MFIILSLILKYQAHKDFIEETTLKYYPWKEIQDLNI